MIIICALTRYQTWNLGVSGYLSNQLSNLATWSGPLIIISHQTIFWVEMCLRWLWLFSFPFSSLTLSSDPVGIKTNSGPWRLQRRIFIELQIHEVRKPLHPTTFLSVDWGLSHNPNMNVTHFDSPKMALAPVYRVPWFPKDCYFSVVFLCVFQEGNTPPCLLPPSVLTERNFLGCCAISAAISSLLFARPPLSFFWPQI